MGMYSDTKGGGGARAPSAPWLDPPQNRIQNATGVHDDLLTMVKKRKLRRYGHISRSSGMAKTILQGTVKGARRRGRLWLVGCVEA